MIRPLMYYYLQLTLKCNLRNLISKVRAFHKCRTFPTGSKLHSFFVAVVFCVYLRDIFKKPRNVM